MQTIAYPSPVAPATRGFTVDAPDGWEPESFPGAIVVIAEPAGDGFRANVLVEVTRTTAETTLENVEPQDDPDAPLLRKETTDVGGIPALLLVQGERSTAWPEPLVRWQVVVVAETGHPELRDLFVVTATCEAARADDYAARFQGIVDSFRFAPL
jgi:hypothetical protein